VCRDSTPRRNHPRHQPRRTGLSIGTVRVQRPGIGDAWRIDASDANGERRAAEHEDYYSAVVMLAELVGWELEE
jgi:hypothetical protein